MLNYLYAILEAEARLALLAVGCDPGVGIHHADQRSRDSMACDVVEAVRPEVDAWLFRFLEIRRLRRQSFVELRNGQCRLMPDLAKELAQTSGLWAQKLGPVVEDLAQALYQHATAPDQRRRWSQSTLRTVRTESISLPTPLTQSRRRHARLSQTSANLPELQEGPALRDSFTREQFFRQVVPALRDIPTAQIAEAVGLSEEYCGKIRSGRGVPSQRHWKGFFRLISGKATRRD
jgi:hypothetical protein